MDAASERSTTFPLDDAITCYLEEEERWSGYRLPRAELCVVGSAFACFFLVTGGVMIALHHTVEQRPGYVSLLEHAGVSSFVLGLVFVAVAMTVCTCAFGACVVWKVLEVLEMAHRYREHRQLCAYEEMRQSFRSSRGGGLDRTLPRSPTPAK